MQSASRLVLVFFLLSELDSYRQSGLVSTVYFGLRCGGESHCMARLSASKPTAFDASDDLANNA